MPHKVRMLNIDEARRLASVTGLIPYKSGDKYGFTQNVHNDMKRLTWTEVEELLSKEDMKIYEIGGYIKILKTIEIKGTEETE